MFAGSTNVIVESECPSRFSLGLPNGYVQKQDLNAEGTEIEIKALDNRLLLNMDAFSFLFHYPTPTLFICSKKTSTTEYINVYLNSAATFKWPLYKTKRPTTGLMLLCTLD